MTSRILPLLALLLLAAGCKSTELSTVWKTSEPLPPPFEKVAVVVVNASAAERRAGEDELAKQIKSARAIPSYTLIGDEQLKDRQKIREVLQAHHIDGVIVVRLVSVDKTTTYYPPTYHAHYGYYDYYDSYVTASPGYTEVDRTIRTEISLYAVKHEQLLWAGSANTTNPSSIRDLVKEVATATAEELRKQGLLR